jgi:hypothetical protein
LLQSTRIAPAASSRSVSPTSRPSTPSGAARGAEFLTKPKRRQAEMRCRSRDPDGRMIEVGRVDDLSDRPPQPAPISR